MKKSKELVRKTGIISLGKISTQVVSFFLLPLYTARLNAEDYGNFDLIVTMAAFFCPLLTMLMEESMFRFLVDAKDEDEKEKIISQTFIFCVFNGAIVCSIVFAVCKFVNYTYATEFILYLMILFLVALSNALSRGLGKIGLYSLSNFISSVIVILLNLFFILAMNWEFKALFVSNVSANLIASIFVMLRLGVWKYIKLSAIDKKLMKEMLRYSMPLVPNSISWSIINASDRLVITGFLGVSSNGLYSVANKFPGLINNFFSFFNIAWREVSAKIVNDNDVEEFDRVFKAVRNGLISITIVLIGCIKIIYPFFINEAYQSSISYVPILAIAVYYLCISAFYGGVFTAYKDTNIIGQTSLLGAIINLAVDLVLVRSIGIYAAAISTLFAAYFMCIYRKLKMQKYLKIGFKSDIVEAVLFAIGLVWFHVDNNFLNIMFASVSVITAIIVSRSFIYKSYYILKNYYDEIWKTIKSGR